MAVTQTTKKTPPYDSDAEESVNGSLLVDGNCYKQIVGILDPSDFLSEKNQYIFKACQQLYAREVSISTVTVHQELESLKVADKCQSPAYLNHLISATPTSLDVKHYAEIVKRLSIYRQMITMSEKIAALGYDPQPDVTGPLDKADEMILAIRKKAAYTPLITPRIRGEMMMARYTQMHNSERGLAVKTGFPRLDRNFGGGFFNGEQIIIAARPGVGKTTLLQSMANYQGKYGGNVLFCSAEMAIEGLTDRDVASILGVHIHEIRAGRYAGDLYDRIIGVAVPQLDETNVFYLESKRGQPLTTSRILSAAIEMQLRHGLSVIFIDYMGLLEDNWGNNQNERLGYISRRLKAIARDLDVPVIVAHQLSREVTKREDKEPQLSDLYESGHLEANADAIIFIHRNNYYDRETTDTSAKLIIAKERQGGKVGFVPLYYDTRTSQYRELETEYSEGDKVEY